MSSREKQIKMLQRAHAMETGAQLAYSGHRDALRRQGRNNEAHEVERMRRDEVLHGYHLSIMLHMLGGARDPRLERIFRWIGHSISWSCRFLPATWAARGARMIESLGRTEYAKMAVEFEIDHPKMSKILIQMSEAERRHEEFFQREFGV